MKPGLLRPLGSHSKFFPLPRLQRRLQPGGGGGSSMAWHKREWRRQETALQRMHGWSLEQRLCCTVIISSLLWTSDSFPGTQQTDFWKAFIHPGILLSLVSSPGDVTSGGPLTIPPLTRKCNPPYLLPSGYRPPPEPIPEPIPARNLPKTDRPLSAGRGSVTRGRSSRRTRLPPGNKWSRGTTRAEGRRIS